MDAMPSVSITVSYDGPALEGGVMDVRDLAPALLSLGKLFEEANRVLYGDKSRISVRVRAGFKAGSFEIDLNLAQTLFRQMRDILAGDTATAVANLLAVLGFVGVSGAVLAGGPIGLFRLLKQLRGKEPTQAFTLEDGNVRLELPHDEWVVVPRETLQLYRDLNVRSAAFGAVRPLEKNGIESFSVRPSDGPKTEPTEIVQKQDLSFFEPPSQIEQSIISQRHKAAYSIVNLSFSEDNKWRLFDGQNAIWARIDDKEFLEGINNNEVAFSKGDILICEVETEQWQSSSGLRTEIRITRVEEHRAATRQLGFPFKEEPPSAKP